MPSIRPFKGIHPAKEYGSKVPISHGIGGDYEKSMAEIESNPYSLLYISNPELYLPGGESLPEDVIQNAAHEKYQEFLDKGILIQDEKESLYIYRLTQGNHKQTGLVGRASLDEFEKGHIKPHELIRLEKARLQMRLLERMNGYMEPIFMSYDSSSSKLDLLNELTEISEPEISFVDGRNALHQLWLVKDPQAIETICSFFGNVENFYICDGHHRIAAAAEYVKAHPESDLSHVMVVVFPSDETSILDYNRAVADLNGMTEDEFIEALKNAGFDVELAGKTPIRPHKDLEFTMVIGSNWYKLEYTGPLEKDSPLADLDVSILQDKVIKDILGVHDPQSDERLSFISGTKGLEGLEKSLQKNMKVAFAIMPATMDRIISVAGAGLTMPPKSTCFEPKPVIGIVLDQF